MPAASTPETRLPANVRLVLDLVRESGRGRHLTTAELFARARARHARIGYSTVYRALQRLRRLGFVDAVAIGDADAVVYEPAAPGHAHLRCEACGRLTDIDYALTARTLRAIEARHGVAIGAAALTFTGRCRECSPPA